jgi:hypothetical protein
MQIEIDAFRVQVAQHFHQVFERPPEPIDRRGCHHVDFAPCDSLKQRIEAWPSLRSLAPEMPLSAKTCTTFQPCRLATASNSRRWFLVV